MDAPTAASIRGLSVGEKFRFAGTNAASFSVLHRAVVGRRVTEAALRAQPHLKVLLGEEAKPKQLQIRLDARAKRSSTLKANRRSVGERRFLQKEQSAVVLVAATLSSSVRAVANKLPTDDSVPADVSVLTDGLASRGRPAGLINALRARAASLSLPRCASTQETGIAAPQTSLSDQAAELITNVNLACASLCDVDAPIGPVPVLSPSKPLTISRGTSPYQAVEQTFPVRSILSSPQLHQQQQRSNIVGGRASAASSSQSIGSSTRVSNKGAFSVSSLDSSVHRSTVVPDDLELEDLVQCTTRAMSARQREQLAWASVPVRPEIHRQIHASDLAERSLRRFFESASLDSAVRCVRGSPGLHPDLGLAIAPQVLSRDYYAAECDYAAATLRTQSSAKPASDIQIVPPLAGLMLSSRSRSAGVQSSQPPLSSLASRDTAHNASNVSDSASSTSSDSAHEIHSLLLPRPSGRLRRTSAPKARTSNSPSIAINDASLSLSDALHWSSDHTVGVVAHRGAIDSPAQLATAALSLTLADLHAKCGGDLTLLSVREAATLAACAAQLRTERVGARARAARATLQRSAAGIAVALVGAEVRAEIAATAEAAAAAAAATASAGTTHSVASGSHPQPRRVATAARPSSRSFSRSGSSSSSSNSSESDSGSGSTRRLRLAALARSVSALSASGFSRRGAARRRPRPPYHLDGTGALSPSMASARTPAALLAAGAVPRPRPIQQTHASSSSLHPALSPDYRASRTTAAPSAAGNGAASTVSGSSRSSTRSSLTAAADYTEPFPLSRPRTDYAAPLPPKAPVPLFQSSDHALHAYRHMRRDHVTNAYGTANFPSVARDTSDAAIRQVSVFAPGSSLDRLVASSPSLLKAMGYMAGVSESVAEMETTRAYGLGLATRAADSTTALEAPAAPYAHDVSAKTLAEQEAEVAALYARLMC